MLLRGIFSTWGQVSCHRLANPPSDKIESVSNKGRRGGGSGIKAIFQAVDR